MSLSRPVARVEVDGRSLSSAEGAVVRTRVVASLGADHDRAVVVCWPSSRFEGTAPGSSMSVSLGEADGEELVWTGEVVARRDGPDGMTLEGLAPTVGLSRVRVSRTYLDQSAADIVRDLAGDVPVEEVEGDLLFDAYHVDDRRTAWAHVLALAELAGAEVGSAPSGGLRMVPPRSGSADETLRHGADLLWWEVGPAAPPTPAAVEAHGAGSESGGAWHWIRRDVGAEGGSPGVRVVGGFSTRDPADRLAEALEGRARDAGRRGVLALTGRPALRPGDLVELADLPGEDPGILRVRSVDHRLDTAGGFVTVLRVSGGAS